MKMRSSKSRNKKLHATPIYCVCENSWKFIFICICNSWISFANFPYLMCAINAHSWAHSLVCSYARAHAQMHTSSTLCSTYFIHVSHICQNQTYERRWNMFRIFSCRGIVFKEHKKKTRRLNKEASSCGLQIHSYVFRILFHSLMNFYDFIRIYIGFTTSFARLLTQICFVNVQKKSRKWT